MKAGFNGFDIPTAHVASATPPLLSDHAGFYAVTLMDFVKVESMLAAIKKFESYCKATAEVNQQASSRISTPFTISNFSLFKATTSSTHPDLSDSIEEN